MPSRTWMNDQALVRERVRRTKGRRATDKLPSFEALLTVGVVLAWAWGGYELAQLFLK